MKYTSTRSKYIHTEISTANKLELVIMCYDKSIQFLRQAKDHLLNKEYETKNEKLSKVINIIGELKCSLDFDQGGDVSKNLEAIYTYLMNRIVEGDLTRNSAVLDEVINILSELREAWQGISPSGHPILMNPEQGLINTYFQQIPA
ncbi:MAG: flagellar export chaperone FliS [Deltaproteobacteria bacterium]|nr:flagellar export chaperone FliS [Deltaproteobacteria bacterium]